MARETELYKDKIEVSLDGRQIFYLFFGGAVIVGLVFVLGVMVGRRVEARGHLERAQTRSAVDPLAALDRLEGGNLTFAGSLRGTEPAASDVEKTIGELARQRAPDPRPVKPEPAAKPAVVVKPEIKPDAKPQAKPELKVDAKGAKPDAKPDAKADAKPDAKADAEAKKPADKKPDADAKKPEKPRFTLQLSSFKDKTEAQSLLDTIKAAGYSAYLTEGDVDGKTFYRVRLGGYRTIEAANDARAELEKTTKQSSSVMKL